MSLNFFPSRTLAIYVGKTFLLRCVAMLAMLVIVLQLLDMLSEAGNVLAFPGNSDAQLWHYVSLRLPQIISRFLPISVLLGTIVTLTTLNANSEVVSMKGGGLSAHQILAPLMVVALLIAGVSFAFNEGVVARATATLTTWQDANYGPMPSNKGVKSNVWVRDGEDLVHAGQVIGDGTDVRLTNVEIYDRHGNHLISVISAPSGQYTGQGWLLDKASSFDVVRGIKRDLGTVTFGKTIRPDQFTLSSVDADGTAYWQLRKDITTLHDAGRPVAALEGNLWHKISEPLSALLMPLLGSVAAFGLARSGQLFVRAVIGMALGFAFFVADNFALSLGSLGIYPPIVAAWAPFLLFLLVGETMLIITEE